MTNSGPELSHDTSAQSDLDVQWSGCILPHLHFRTSGETNSEANDEHTNHIFALSFVASFASPLVTLALEAVLTRVKGDKWWFVLCVQTCECSYACENSSFAQRRRHTNVCASGEARHEHKCVNAVLQVCEITKEEGRHRTHAFRGLYANVKKFKVTNVPKF